MSCRTIALPGVSPLIVLAMFWGAGCAEAQERRAEAAPAAEKPKAETKASGSVKVDPQLPDYKAVSGVSGTIRSVGSDTMNNLMTVWCEGFKKHYPSVTFAVEGKGSSTAMPALENGAATFGPMSRLPK